jgi:hypothetical protein
MREITEEVKDEILKNVLEKPLGGRINIPFAPKKLYSFEVRDKKIVDWTESNIYEPHEYDRLITDCSGTISMESNKEQIIVFTLELAAGRVFYLFVQA